MKKIVAKRILADKDGTVSAAAVADALMLTTKSIADTLEQYSYHSPSVQLGKGSGQQLRNNNRISLNANTWHLIDPSLTGLILVPPSGGGLIENVTFSIKNITTSTTTFRIQATEDIPVEDPGALGQLSTSAFNLSGAGVSYTWTWLGQLSIRGWWLTSSVS